MILNVGKNATLVFISILAATSTTACNKTQSAAQSQLLAAPTQPRSEELQQLTARVKLTSPFLNSLLLRNAPSTRQPGLTSAYQINPTQTSEQLIGMIRASEAVAFRASATTRSGEQVDCRNLLQASSANEKNSFTLSFSCNGMPVTVALYRQPVATERIGAWQTRQALIAQSTLMLRNNLDNIAVTLQQDKIIVDSASQSTRYPISATEREKFLSGNDKIKLTNGSAQCLRAPCIENTELQTLQLTASGELVLESASPSGSNLKTYKHQPQRTVRVASYNVENFWDDLPNNSSAYDDYSDAFSNWHSGRFAEKKTERIRTALVAAGLPEVVALQEIESAANQSRSLELLKPVLSELGYNHYALGQQAQDNPTAVTTAVISKLPLAENTRIDFLFKPDEMNADEQKDFIGASRDPQRVSVILPEGTVFTLLNSHWKSKRDKSPWGDVMRRSLAELMRKHIETLRTAEGGAAAAMIVGDFNADYREEPVHGGLQLAQSLTEARLAQQPQKLVPLWLTLSAGEQGDYPHDSHFQALDNIIITRSMLQDGPLVLGAALQVVGRTGATAEVLSNGDGLPMRSQLRKYKDSAGQMRTTHFDMGFSDHLPIVAHFIRASQGQSNPTAQLFEESIETQKISELPQVEIQGASCQVGRKIQSPESLATLQQGECVTLSEVALQMQKTGLHHIYVQLNGTTENAQPSEKVVITADRAFGANKSWLRGTLQSSAGKTLKFVRGRIGVVEGYKAIFIHSPGSDIAFE